MYFNLVLAGLLLISAACKKDKERGHEMNRVSALLTKSEWAVSACGFDSNTDGIIDEHENILPECQKDNTYLFGTNGTAWYFDNSIQCGTGDTENTFNWKLTDNDSMLDMQYYTASVVAISEDRLVLSPVRPANVPLRHFLIFFRRWKPGE